MAWDDLDASRENLRLINKFIMRAKFRKSKMVVDKLLFCDIYSTFTLSGLDQWPYCTKQNMFHYIVKRKRLVNNEFRLRCGSNTAVQLALSLDRC